MLEQRYIITLSSCIGSKMEEFGISIPSTYPSQPWSLPLLDYDVPISFNLTWYQRQRSRVRILADVIYKKIKINYSLLQPTFTPKRELHVRGSVKQ
jgi:hypothetical protein